MLKQGLLLVCCVAISVNSENILFLSGLPSPSHHIWNSAITNALAARGHKITVISPDLDKKPPQGVNYIEIDGLYAEFHTEYVKTLFDYKLITRPYLEPFTLLEALDDICLSIVKSNGFKTLLNYSDDYQFDLVLYDFTVGPCLLPFLHKFKYPPLVGVTAYSHPSYVPSLVGGHQYYGYIPHNAFTDYDTNMNFWQRLYNLFIYLEDNITRDYIHCQKVDKLAAKHFGPGLPSVVELEQRTALAFVNTNPAIDYPAPLPENVIPVGGLQIKEVQKLPQELESFINLAKKGAVLFSLGSNLRSDQMNPVQQVIFLNAFRQLPDYHFLWKFESNSSTTVTPKNVLRLPWMPQSDILAHPKVKTFITHGGLLSSHEAIWYGVPIIGMPFFFDQHANVMKLKKLGIAEYFDYHTITTPEVKAKLLKVLENTEYAAKAKIISAQFKDQKEKPLDRAVWWIEWILRNPNCEHLKSPTLRLGHIRSNSFDLVAFITVFCIGLLYFLSKTVFFMVRVIFRCCNKKSPVEALTKKHPKKE